MCPQIQEFLRWFSENFVPGTILVPFFSPKQDKIVVLKKIFPTARVETCFLNPEESELVTEFSSVEFIFFQEEFAQVLDPWRLIRQSKKILDPRGFLLLVQVISGPSPPSRGFWHFGPEIFEKFGDYIGQKLIFYQGEPHAPETLFLLATPEGKLPEEFPLYLGVKPLFPYGGEASWATRAFASPYHPRRAPLEYNLDPASVWGKVLELVPYGAQVLDVGCGPGFVGAALARLKSCHVSGIELNPLAAQLARRTYKKVLEVDLEKASFDKEFPPQSFDVILFLDILEHLARPAKVLHNCQRLLKPEGMVIVSVPNVAYASVVAELLRGRWQYRPWGILDETHLRFFTREGLFHLAEEAGLHLEALHRVVIDPEILEYNQGATAWLDLPSSVREFVRRENSEYLTYQFVALMRPGLTGKTTKTKNKFKRFLKEAKFKLIEVES